MAHFVTSKVRTRTRTMNLNMEATGGPPKETSTFWALKGNPQRPDEKVGDEDVDEELHVFAREHTRPPPHIAFIFQQSTLPLNDSDRTPRFSPHPTTPQSPPSILWVRNLPLSFSFSLVLDAPIDPLTRCVFRNMQSSRIEARQRSFVAWRSLQ